MPQIKPEHVDPGAKVFADRYAYMRTLPVGAVGAEVGVYRGDFSAFLLEQTKPVRLHLIDRDTRHVVQRFADRANVECHEGPSAATLGSFRDGYFDWIYIDAGHDYKDVRADADAASPKLKSDGLLIFNDYIMWTHREWRYYGVVPVVNELCVNEGWQVEAFCLSATMNCDIALRRRV